MQLITGAQVRMARSLLKWSRQKLAKEAHVGRGTIATFEDDQAIRENNIFDLYNVFDAHGVEFMPDGAVKTRDLGIKDFRGVGSCDRFFDYLQKTVKGNGGDVICMTDSQSLLTKSSGQQKRTNLERMEQLHKSAPIKCLLMDSKIILPSCPSFEVRVLQDMPINMPCSIWAYGKEYTHALEIDPRLYLHHPVYMVVESPHNTSRMLESFHARWNFAKPYPFGGSTKAA